MEYDPYAPEVQADPYPYYRWMRDEAPAYYCAARDLWALSRYDDVKRASRDSAAYSTLDGTDPDRVGKELGLNGFLDLDPPRHDELRKIVFDAFTPAAVAPLESDIAARADRLIDAFASDGEADLALGYAWALPLGVVAGIIGIPESDIATLIKLIFTCYEPSPFEWTDQVKRAAAELQSYFGAALDERVRTPADDVLTRLMGARRNGEATHEEVVETCVLLFAAGYTTTAGLVGGALHLLAGHPDERAALAAHPDRLPVAIEEFLRIEPPIQTLARTTTGDVDVCGTVMPKGSRVMLLYASANRDERQFADPDRLDLARSDNHHLAFGEGVHKCLGNTLARLEGRVAIERLLARIPDYEVAGPVTRVASPVSREIVSMPVRFTPR